MSNHLSKGLRKVIIASSVGTIIEWYDFYIFGTLAPILATRFFPPGNEVAAFLFTLAAFGVGFVVRPFGALVFGRLGDIVGRKYTFMLTLLLMGGSTFAIGLIPDYKSINILAPIIVFVLRALQGLALGGEYGGATIYVAEHSPENKRGYFTSFIQTTATLGLFISIGVILGCKAMLGEEVFSEWGWRIPFLVSIILVIISYFIRKRMDESPEFAKLKQEGKTSKNPLKESFTKWSNLKWVLIALFGAAAGQGVVWYTGQYYAMNFCIKTLHINSTQVQKIMLLVLLAAVPLFILFGKLSDHIGRKWIMLTGMLLAAVFYLPIYKAMEGLTAGLSPIEGIITLSQDKVWIMAGLIFIQLVFVAMAYGPIAAFLVELFPARIRYSSMSLPYHIGNGVFGGLTPLIAESLVVGTKNIYAGLYYPIAVALMTVVVGVIFIRKRINE